MITSVNRDTDTVVKTYKLHDLNFKKSGFFCIASKERQISNKQKRKKTKN